MIPNYILILWITINPVDLQYLFVIYFANEKLFHIIFDAIFMSLFSVEQTKEGFFELISNYFGIIEINGCKIPHLHCLMWLKSISHLATLLT